MSEQQPREEDLIPHRASSLEGGRWLALAAHPDDETLGAGGTLALNASRAKVLRVWIATDGEKQSGAGPSAQVYAASRREEARRATETLGLPSPCFGGLPDRGLSDRRRELEEELKRQIRDLQPDLVLCPSPVEIHPDHRVLAEALYDVIAASRPGDADHESFRFLRIAYYELTQPFLPNVLVDISSVAERKREAVAAYASQQAVRDYAGAVAGLNAYRRLTLEGGGPVEAFRVLGYAEASTHSLEQFRRSIGPAIVSDGERGIAPVSVVVRTRNRPSLLAEALDSVRAQTARPNQVVIVNDGGAAVGEVIAPFRDAFAIELQDVAERGGRSNAANRGVEAARCELVAFLDDDDRYHPDHVERLMQAFRAGPEPVVYSDAATVVYERRENRWEERVRTLQYSLDFDADYLLLANYIPIHTLLLPKALFEKVGGFDRQMEYSEDWDFLIRLSFETAFRHVRAVTCDYRVFEERSSDSQHEEAGGAAFARARRQIFDRYADRRTPEGIGRVMDRLRAQIAHWSGRDAASQGELRYQRESHRRLYELWENAASRLATVERSLEDVTVERNRLSAENEIVHARLAELFTANERYAVQAGEAQTQIDRLNGTLQEIFSSRTWKLHLFLDRLRGRH